MAETSIISVVIAALTVQPSNYGTFINYMHTFCLLLVIETSATGIGVFFSKGYLSKIMPLTEQMNNYFPTTKITDVADPWKAPKWWYYKVSRFFLSGHWVQAFPILNSSVLCQEKFAVKWKADALTISSNNAAPLMGQVQHSQVYLTHLTWWVAARELHPSLSPAFDTKQKCTCSTLQEYYNSSLRKMKGW